jgi:hypothetical protein
LSHSPGQCGNGSAGAQKGKETFMNEKMGMQEFTIKRTGKPPLRFTGELIGSGLNNGHENYEIVAPVSIYRTKGGKFVSVITYAAQLN